MNCPRCGVIWVRTVEIPSAAGEARDPICPACRTLEPQEVSDGGVASALEAEPTNGIPVVPEESSTGASLYSRLLYGASLPERLVRGAIGLTAGAARELADFLVPRAFKDSASYKLAIENSLGFLTESIGGIARPKGDGAAEEVAAGETIARKAVGNFVDLAGLATLHVSPMWMLAVVSDVAYGSASFAQELGRELQAQGLIDDASSIHHVDDVLSAVQRTCGTAASSFDQPPLSVDELRRTIETTRQSLSETDLRRLLPEAELRRYWDEMRQVARDEQVSLLGVSATITMQTLNRMRTAGQSAVVGLQVAGGLLNRNLLGHYRESLQRIQQTGLLPAIRDSYGPYVTAVWDNFSSEKKSWTETLLDPATVPSLWRRALQTWRGDPTVTNSTSADG